MRLFWSLGSMAESRLICSTSRWRECPVSRELRSCAVVGVEARRGVIEPVAGRRAPGGASRRLGAGLLSPTGIADQQRPDAAALARLDLVGGSSPKGSIRRRPSGARTPPSASPSTPHLGAECGRGRPRTKSSSAETGAELTSRLGANRRKGPDIRRVPARDSWLVVRMRTGRPRTRSGRGRSRAHSLFAVDRCQCLWGFRVSRWDAARGGHLAPLDAAPGPSKRGALSTPLRRGCGAR